MSNACSQETPKLAPSPIAHLGLAKRRSIRLIPIILLRTVGECVDSSEHGALAIVLHGRCVLIKT